MPSTPQKGQGYTLYPPKRVRVRLPKASRPKGEASKGTKAVFDVFLMFAVTLNLPLGIVRILVGGFPGNAGNALNQAWDHFWRFELPMVELAMTLVFIGFVGRHHSRVSTMSNGLQSESVDRSVLSLVHGISYEYCPTAQGFKKKAL
ncbi:hypothetical protein JOM56_015028 [Amanita muscaria]